MHRFKFVVLCVVAGGAIVAPAAFAAAPDPTPGEPRCGGLIVAYANHQSGQFGASGNPKSSAGPGYFLKQDTREAIEFVRATYC